MHGMGGTTAGIEIKAIANARKLYMFSEITLV